MIKSNLKIITNLALILRRRSVWDDYLSDILKSPKSKLTKRNPTTKYDRWLASKTQRPIVFKTNFIIFILWRNGFRIFIKWCQILASFMYFMKYDLLTKSSTFGWCSVCSVFSCFALPSRILRITNRNS